MPVGLRLWPLPWASAHVDLKPRGRGEVLDYSAVSACLPRLPDLDQILLSGMPRGSRGRAKRGRGRGTSSAPYATTRSPATTSSGSSTTPTVTFSLSGAHDGSGVAGVASLDDLMQSVRDTVRAEMASWPRSAYGDPGGDNSNTGSDPPGGNLVDSSVAGSGSGNPSPVAGVVPSGMY